MTELSPDMKRLMQAARESLSPAPDRIAAVRTALSARIQRQAADGPTGTGPSATAFRIPTKWISIALMATTFGGSLWLATRDGGESTPEAAKPETRVAPATTIPDAIAEAPAPAPEPTFEAAPAPPPSAAAAPSAAAPAKVVRRASKKRNTIAKTAEPGRARGSEAPATGRAASGASVAAETSAAATSSDVSETSAAFASAPAGDERAPSPKPAPAIDDSLAREVALLGRARAALSNGKAHVALSLADEHASSFPQGRLRQERLATRALALCALGRLDDARAAIRELDEAAPRSPHKMRIREACAAHEESKKVD